MPRAKQSEMKLEKFSFNLKCKGKSALGLQKSQYLRLFLTLLLLLFRKNKCEDDTVILQAVDVVHEVGHILQPCGSKMRFY